MLKRISILREIITLYLSFISLWFKNEKCGIDFRLKPQTPNVIQIDSVLLEMEHADKHSLPVQQTTDEINIGIGGCPLGTLLMILVKCYV